MSYYKGHKVKIKGEGRGGGWRWDWLGCGGGMGRKCRQLAGVWWRDGEKIVTEYK